MTDDDDTWYDVIWSLVCTVWPLRQNIERIQPISWDQEYNVYIYLFFSDLDIFPWRLSWPLWKKEWRCWMEMYSSCSTLYQVELGSQRWPADWLTVSDFLTFKEMFVDYKLMKDGGGPCDQLSDVLAVSSIGNPTTGQTRWEKLFP